MEALQESAIGEQLPMQFAIVLLIATVTVEPSGTFIE
jgi:hypothetical protein